MVSFSKKLAEAITLKLIVEVIFAVVVLILGYLNRDMIWNFLLYPLPIWITIIIAFSMILLVGIARFLHSRGRGEGILLAVPHRPENPRCIFDVDMFGVKWKVLYGSYMSFGEPYAFSEGPFCPKCMFEMDKEKRGLIRRNYYWKCIPCNKFYKIPVESSHDAARAVEKYIESKIRTGHVNLERGNQ